MNTNNKILSLSYAAIVVITICLLLQSCSPYKSAYEGSKWCKDSAYRSKGVKHLN